MCDKLVKHFPLWLAPNLITLIGFLFNLVPNFIVFGLYGQAMDGPIDSWVLIMIGIAYFIATTLDNCDGKQARRTGTSSAMG